MRWTAFGLVALLALAGVARPGGEATKNDLKRMEGTWTVVAHETDGKKLTEEDAKGVEVKLVVKDGKYTIYFNGKKGITGKLKLDASKNPKQIAAVAEEGPYKGKAMLGIYELKGDEMRVCFAQPTKDRPTEFRTEKGSGLMLLGYRRVVPKK
jgi:uncharacterized protein (TIGR03067 family)